MEGTETRQDGTDFLVGDVTGAHLPEALRWLASGDDDDACDTGGQVTCGPGDDACDTGGQVTCGHEDDRACNTGGRVTCGPPPGGSPPKPKPKPKS